MSFDPPAALPSASIQAAIGMPVIVAIPVKDEAERIVGCLRALAWQRDSRAHEILLLLNNCTDQTAEVVRELAPALPVPVHVVVAAFPPETSHAGHARSLAMRHAAERAGPRGILLTTDADGRVAPDWIATNLAALRNGAEAVAGRADIDPVEALRIPAHLHADDALECAYATLLDEIECLVDPDPADPWPRHNDHSGASLAASCAAFHRAGGMPDVALGEDRAFVASLRRVDAAIRHAPEVRVTVSGRIEGRAQGGMADTIRRRIQHQDEWIDDRLEPARNRLRRGLLRARFRAARRRDSFIAELAGDLRLSSDLVAEALALPFLGAGWELVEARSPVLRQKAVRRLDLARETAAAETVLRRLRRASRQRPDDGLATLAGAAAPAAA